MTAQQLPHHYSISAEARERGDVSLNGTGIPVLLSAPPAQFGGPGDKWSPEDLLVAAVADCFILTFRAIAQASRMDWVSIECKVEGKLDRVERVNQFTTFEIDAKLTVGAGVDPEKAKSLLAKAESNCMITNSLRSSCHLKSEVVVQSRL